MSCDDGGDRDGGWTNFFLMILFVVVMYFLAKPFVANLIERLEDKDWSSSVRMMTVDDGKSHA